MGTLMLHRVARTAAVALAAAALAPRLGSEDTGSLILPVTRYGVRVEGSMFGPMRDGIRLSTDLYFPVRGPNKLPAIYVSTPYNKRGWRKEGPAGPQGHAFAGQGYAVAVQDRRGVYESEGGPYDPKDG